LHPYIEKIDSFLKDSQNLIQDAENRKIENNAKIYSLDFESLYTNIHLDDALFIITNFAKDKLDNDYLDIIAFNSILKLFFDSNIFTCDEEYYKQQIGIGMGIVFGPTCANIVVYHYENIWYNLQKPIYYKRFIDDIFVILSNDENLQILLNSFSYLKLNFITGDIINFLDLNISFNKLTNRLNFSLYVKPTNTHSYLLNDSNHPTHIFKNIPRSLLFRIRKNCSSYSNFLYHAGMTTFYLEKRGYDKNKLLKVVRTIGNIERESLIPYREKNDKFNFENSVMLRLPFDRNFNMRLLSSSIKTFISDFLKMKPFIINCLQPSLSKL